MDRPNILMIVVDCLRADRVFGDDRSCKTPHLDQLAQRGTKVPNLYVETSITGPSFASIFTGCSCLRHGVTALLGKKLNPELTTLAQIFQANGYKTAAHVTGPLIAPMGLDKGFDEYNYRNPKDYYFTDWGEEFVSRIREDQKSGPWFQVVHFWEVHEPRQVPPEFDAEEFGETEYDRSVSALDQYLGKLFDAAGENTAIIFTGDHGERVDEPFGEDSLLPYFLDKLGIRQAKDNEESRIDEDAELLQYCGSELHDFSSRLGAADESNISIGERLKIMGCMLRIAVHRLKIQKTIPSTHGFREMLHTRLNDLQMFLSVMRGKKMDAQLHLLKTTLTDAHLQHGYHIYEYLNRVPLLISGLNGFSAGKVREKTVRNLDILPTICQSLNFQVPDLDCHGESFFPSDETGAEDDSGIYLEARGGADALHAFFVQGIKTGNYKLAFAPYEKDAPLELFDLKADPLESQNLAAQMPDLASQLRKQAEEIVSRYQSGAEEHATTDEEQDETIEKLKSLGYM